MRSLTIGEVLFKNTGMEIVFNGIVSGVVLALLVGPVFFTIIQTSVERGFTSGVFVAIGVSLSDALYICISYLGLAAFFDNDSAKSYLAYGGGMVLLLFGLYYLFIKSRRLSNFDPESISYKNPGKLIAKGFVINGLSPMVLFFWLATVGVATSEFNYVHTREVVTYFSTLVLTVFGTDVLKAKLADRLRILITPRSIRLLNIILGLVLVIFAGQLIFFPERIPH
jgi:threonine/homoserine/homoserine lactone efflux protein